MPAARPETRQASRYLELISGFALRSIRSDNELEKAIVVLDSLLDKGSLDVDEQDYLDVLSDLVEKYEAEEDPFPSVSGGEMLRHLIEARNLTQIRLAEETGIANSTISSILSGKRGLTRDQITTLARYFKVSPALFIPA